MHINMPQQAMLAGLALIGTASAQFITSETMSFGQKGHISHVNAGIPGWNLFGQGHSPQILSDRVILTPPGPGHTKGALWMNSAVDQPHWLAEVRVRASGQEHGSGNFQIWYAKDGQRSINSNAIYSTASFEGLVLVVDQYGGHGGMLRAFLNDGSTTFKDRSDIEVNGLAFGHCAFSYRNLGTPSRIRLISDANGFRVDIDDRACFASDQVELPKGYTFGLTATTADNPDSFEVSSFALSLAQHQTDSVPPPADAAASQAQQNSAQQPMADKKPVGQQQKPVDGRSGYSKYTDTLVDLYTKIATLTAEVFDLRAQLRELGPRMVELQKSHERNTASVEALRTQVIQNVRDTTQLKLSIDTLIKQLAGHDYKETFAKINKAMEKSGENLDAEAMKQSKFLHLQFCQVLTNKSWFARSWVSHRVP